MAELGVAVTKITGDRGQAGDGAGTRSEARPRAVPGRSKERCAFVHVKLVTYHTISLRRRKRGRQDGARSKRSFAIVLGLLLRRAGRLGKALRSLGYPCLTRRAFRAADRGLRRLKKLKSCSSHHSAEGWETSKGATLVRLSVSHSMGLPSCGQGSSVLEVLFITANCKMCWSKVSSSSHGPLLLRRNMMSSDQCMYLRIHMSKSRTRGTVQKL